MESPWKYSGGRWRFDSVPDHHKIKHLAAAKNTAPNRASIVNGTFLGRALRNLLALPISMDICSTDPVVGWRRRLHEDSAVCSFARHFRFPSIFK